MISMSSWTTVQALRPTGKRDASITDSNAAVSVLRKQAGASIVSVITFIEILTATFITKGSPCGAPIVGLKT